MQAIRLASATAAALIAGLFTQGAWAACYVVYGADKQIIYRSQTPPVDLSRDLHETLPQVAPGGTLVFSLDNHGCEHEVNRLPAAGNARAAGKGAADKGAAAAQQPRADRG